MSVVIVAEGGSTWAGNKKNAYELTKIAKEAGASFMKWQLFDKGSEYDRSGNVYLDPGLFTEFIGYGDEFDIPVGASVFSQKTFDFVFGLQVPFIKFAHSQRTKTDWIRATVQSGKCAVVSTDVMSVHLLERIGRGSSDGRLVKLFCEPVYPKMWHTNFENLFPDRFHGYSDHSLGIEESLRAVQAGAMWLERHVTLPYNECIATPDGRFALRPDQFKELCRQLRP